MKKKFFVVITICLLLAVGWWLLSVREYHHKPLTSPMPPEECYLCKEQNSEGNVGFLNLNTWDLAFVKLNLYEDGQQTEEYQIETGMQALDGTTVEMTAYPNRGYAYGTISGCQYKLDRAFIQERLCQKCLNKINETDFYGEAPAEYALVDFTDKSICVLAKGRPWIYTEEYKIGCAFEVSGTVKLLIHDL